MSKINNYIEPLSLILILILTCIIYSNSLKNNFTSWDDNANITLNNDIRDLNTTNIKKYFTTYSVGMYQPLTTLSFAINYKISKLSPKGYHLTNLILHLLNILLVFWLIKLLTQNNKKDTITERSRSDHIKTITPLLTALLFAIHPMFTESVTWLSERKDVLYTFFFLSSLITYLYYLQKNIKHQTSNIKHQTINVIARRRHDDEAISPKRETVIARRNDEANQLAGSLHTFKINYTNEAISPYIKYLFLLFSIILFLFSLFSKSSAVVLPAVLFLIDYYYRRKLNIMLFAEKSFHILLALIFIYFALKSQYSAHFMDYAAYKFSTLDRLFLISYSFIFYLVNWLIPHHLSAVHPYPLKHSGFLPWDYYASAIVFLVIAATIWILLTKLKKENRKTLAFGLLFFVCMILPVIQLVPLPGYAITGERYTYMPYIGLFFILACWFSSILNKPSLIKYTSIAVLSIMIIAYSITTYNRNKVWFESYTLYTDIIYKYPSFPIAYNNRGNALYDKNEYERAAADYEKAIELNPDYTEAYTNRGIIKKTLQKDYYGALDDFNKAISLKPDYAEAYYNRGNTYGILQKFPQALDDYNNALKYKPDFALAYYNRALTEINLKDTLSACNDWQKVLSLGYPQASEMIRMFCK